MHISDILKEPSEKLYSRTYRESYKNPCEVAVPLTHIFFHFENSGAVAVPRTHIFFHFQTLVRWPYHSRTYSSIFKLWCGGRTTHAHILPFSNSGAVAVPLTHIFFHFQTLVRWPYHSRTYSSIFKTLVRWPYHSRTYSSIFKTLVRWPYHSRTYSSISKTLVRWPNHSRTNFKFKSPVQWPYHPCTCPKSIKPTWAHMKRPRNAKPEPMTKQQNKKTGQIMYLERWSNMCSARILYGWSIISGWDVSRRRIVNWNYSGGILQRHFSSDFV